MAGESASAIGLSGLPMISQRKTLIAHRAGILSFSARLNYAVSVHWPLGRLRRSSRRCSPSRRLAGAVIPVRRTIIARSTSAAGIEMVRR